MNKNIQCSVILPIFCFFLSAIHFTNSKTRTQFAIDENLFLQPMVTTSADLGRNGKVTRPVKSSTLLEPVEGQHKGAKEYVTKSDNLCQGACISSKSCDQHGGVVKGHCGSGGSSVCCVFERSCGGISREKISFFRSPHYPVSINESVDCTYDVYPSENICALKIDFLSFQVKASTHYAKVEKCVSDAMYLLNTEQGANEPLCDMENHTAIAYLKKNSVRPAKFVMITQSEDVKWNLKITQINCKKLKPWKNEPKCGRQLMYEPNVGDENSVEDEDSSSSKEMIQRRLQIHPLIVNGKDAENREFPWQISLQTRGKGSHRCGGSILNQKYILTAAHCIMRNAYEPKGKMKVIVGDYNLNSTEEVEHEEFEIESIIGHFHYKPQKSHLNDIAILKVKGTINYSPNIQPVCLPPANFSTDGKIGWVSGWGRLNGTDPKASASTLQKLQVTVVNGEECQVLVRQEIQKILNRSVTTDEVLNMARLGHSATQLCARPKLHSAVCFGDSGGPLVVQNEEDGSFIQVGVVSYGLGKCVTTRNPPAAYTKVSEFLQFLAIATSDDELGI